MDKRNEGNPEAPPTNEGYPDVPPPYPGEQKNTGIH